MNNQQTHLQRAKEEARKILHSELEVDYREYTPDQGMPPIIFELNDAQLDYFVEKIVTSTYLQAKQEGVTEDTSDGYHTFKELYEFRKFYNATLFNEWYKQSKYSVHKSTKHSDGEDCFGGGWFIVVATLPTGDISNHYELKDWDLFNCETRELAKEWDGHTSEDVLQRLQSLKQTKDKLLESYKS